MAAPRWRSSFLFISWPHLVVGFFFSLYIVPILVYRQLLILFAKWFRPDLSQILRGHSPMLLDESAHREPNLNILFSFHMNGPLDIERTKQVFKERMVYWKAQDKNGDFRLAFPELTQYCVKWGGYFFWTQESDFKFDEHVRVHTLGPNEDISSVKVKYIKEPLLECRSPWELLLVDEGRVGQVEKAKHSVLFKFHHSLADGYAISQLLIPLADPDGQIVYPSRVKKPKPVPTRALLGLTFPVRLLAGLVHLLTARTRWPPWPQIPPEPFASGMRQHRVKIGDGQQIEWAVIKAIARELDVSTTAVVYGTLTGALRTYLMSKYGADGLPSNLNYAQPLLLPNHPEGLCNILSAVTFRLPVGTSDLKRRIQTCDRTIKGLHNSVLPLLGYFMIDMLCTLPRWFPFRTRLCVNPSQFSTTYLAGPLKLCRMGGQPVLDLDYQMAAPPYPLYLGMMTYNGLLKWAVNGDERVFTESDIAHFGQALKDEFATLEKIRSSWEEPVNC